MDDYDVSGETLEYDEDAQMLGASLEEDLYESKSFKPKGSGMGNPNKFKFSKKPNQEGGFKENMKQGTKGVGMGSAKKVNVYKETPINGDFKIKPKTKTKKETKESMTMMPKKVETKEASRTLGNGKYWGCLLYTSPSPRDLSTSRMPSSA